MSVALSTVEKIKQRKELTVMGVLWGRGALGLLI